MLISEIVQEFGVTRQAVALAIRNNALPARKRGSQWFVARDAVIAYFARTEAKRGRPKGAKNRPKKEERADANA